MDIITKNAELAEVAARILYGIATEDDLKRVKREDVYAIKSDGENVHVRSMVNTKAEQEGKRRFRYIANAETPDRMGDIIRQAGWDFRDFKTNPIALWAHNDKQFPIGTVHDIEVGPDRKGVPTLLESIEYLDKDVSEDADKVFKLVNAGVIKAVSVGFRPLKTYVPKNEEDRKSIGLGPYGVEYKKQAQLELSNCSIPAHQNALRVKTMVETELRSLVSKRKLTKSEADELWTIADRLEQGEKKIFSLGGIKAGGSGDGTEIIVKTEGPECSYSYTDNFWTPGTFSNFPQLNLNPNVPFQTGLILESPVSKADFGRIENKIDRLLQRLESLEDMLEQMHENSLATEDTPSSDGAGDKVENRSGEEIIERVMAYVRTNLTGDSNDA